MEHLNLDQSEKKHKWNTRHCSPEMVDAAKEGYHDMHTTLRNPYHVAISWANRGKANLGSQSNPTWYEQWNCLAQIIPLATVHKMDEFNNRVNTAPDKLNLYKAIEANDMEYYYQHVPKKWINHAIDRIKPYYNERL